MRTRHFLASSLVATVAAFTSGATGFADDASRNYTWGDSPTQPVVEFATHDPSVGSANHTRQIEFANEGPRVEFTSLGSGVGNDKGGGSCDSCGPSRILIGGAEATFLWADVNGQAGEVDTFGLSGAPAGSFSSDVTEVDQLNTAPRVWLGVQGDRWSVVGRFWDYRAGNTLLGGADTVGFASHSNLRAYTMDLEAGRKYCYRDWNGTISLGVRHALLESDSSIFTTTIPAVDTIVTGFAATDRQFSGTGLTYALSGSRAVRCDSPMSLFWNVRSSILWGTNTAVASAGTSAIGLVGGTADIDNAIATSDSDEVFIFETQAGVQWEHELKCMPASAFFKIAGEYQYWDSSANLTAVASSISRVVSAEVVSADVGADASAGSQELNLFGFTIGAGFER